MTNRRRASGHCLYAWRWFFFGDAKSTLRELQTLAIDLDCVIISVDYRLAPEANYAGSIVDKFAVDQVP
jgi:acetyl esterase/lipase